MSTGPSARFGFWASGFDTYVSMGLGASENVDSLGARRALRGQAPRPAPITCPGRPGGSRSRSEFPSPNPHPNHSAAQEIRDLTGGWTPLHCGARPGNPPTCSSAPDRAHYRTQDRNCSYRAGPHMAPRSHRMSPRCRAPRLTRLLDTHLRERPLPPNQADRFSLHQPLPEVAREPITPCRRP